MAFMIDENCINCGSCIEECMFDAISRTLDVDKCIIDSEKCVECGMCVDVCPLDQIVRDNTTDPVKAIRSIDIIPDKCIGCSLCAKKCPVGAITGTIKEPFILDHDKCIKCGVCAGACRKDAFDVVYM